MAKSAVADKGETGLKSYHNHGDYLSEAKEVGSRKVWSEEHAKRQEKPTSQSGDYQRSQEIIDISGRDVIRIAGQEKSTEERGDQLGSHKATGILKRSVTKTIGQRKPTRQGSNQSGLQEETGVIKWNTTETMRQRKPSGRESDQLRSQKIIGILKENVTNIWSEVRGLEERNSDCHPLIFGLCFTGWLFSDVWSEHSVIIKVVTFTPYAFLSAFMIFVNLCLFIPGLIIWFLSLFK